MRIYLGAVRHSRMALRPALLTACVILGLLLASAKTAWALFTIVYDGTKIQLATGTLTNPSGLALDLNGNLYIADYDNTANANCQILKVLPNGSVSRLDNNGSFNGVGALKAAHHLVVDSSGNLYIADTGNNRIVKVIPSGTASVVSTGSYSLNAPQGVAIDALGNIFIADTGNNRILEVTSSGTSLFSTTVASTALSSPVALATDIYNDLFIVDKGNNRVVEITAAPALQGSVIGTYQSLAAPVDVAVGNNGIIYIADGSTQVRVALHDPQGDEYDLFSDDLNSNFGVPSAIATDSKGGFYLTDTESGNVNLFHQGSADFGHVQLGSSGTPETLNFVINATTTVTGVAIYTTGTQNLDFTIAANSGTPCITSSSGITCTVNVQFTPTAAGLRRGALVLSYDNEFLGSGNFTVPLFGVGDAPVATLAPGIASPVSTGSLSFTNPFKPFQTAYDGVGNIYATDTANNRVLKIPAGGGAATVVNIPTLPSPATILHPTGIAIDGAGNLFVADAGNNRIVEITATGASEIINIIGAFSGFNNPQSLFINSQGDLIVDDAGNNRIVDLTISYAASSDNTLDIVGAYTLSTGLYSLATGTASGSPYNYSTSAIMDVNDNLFVADDVNNRVIKIDRFGKSSLVDFSSLSGSLTTPHSLAFDPMGNLYVMDGGGSQGAQRVIQQFTTGTNNILAFTGSALGTSPNQIAVDNGGNVLVSDYSTTSGRLLFINSGVSSFTYPTVQQGATGATQTATVTNLGDLPLIFSANPTYTASFSQNASDTNLCTSETSLSVGINCDVSIVFTPQSIGNLSANIAVTDNTQNVGGSTQLIQVSGTATNPADSTSTALSFSPTGGTYTYGQALSITATVSDTATGHTSLLPTGTVNITDAYGNTTATLNGSVSLSAGVATISNVVLPPSASPHTITAAYSGVTNTFATSNHSSNITVSQASVLIAGTSVSLAPGTAGASTITLTPSTSGGIAPTGSVTYTLANGSNTTVASGSVVLTAGSGNTATASVPVGSTLSPGTYTLSISYAGDTNYQSGTSPQIAVTIAQITPAITWTPSTSITYGTTLSGLLTATASNGGNSIPGTFTFTATPSGGTASQVTTSTILVAGNYTLTATFTPTSTTTYTTKTATASLTVSKATSAVTLVSSLNPAIVTSAVSFTATLSSSSGTPSGTVSFYDGTTLLGSVTLSSLRAVYTTSSLATGTHSITAVYSGDNNFLSVTSSAVAELVQDFTISTPTSGTTNTPTATVTPGGTATYTLNIGPSVGTVFPAPVTLSLSGLPPGATGALSPTILPAGSSLSTVTLTIQLPQQTAQLERKASPLRGVPLVLGVLLLPFARKWRRAGKEMAMSLTLLLVLAICATASVGLSGCSSTNGFFAQAQTTYTVTITATSGSLSHSTNVTLTVE